MSSADSKQFKPKEDGMEAKTEVRLVGDPNRIGYLTGRQRSRGPRLSYQVRFPDRTTFVPEDQLEPIEGEDDDPVDRLEGGKVGRPIDLRQVLTHVRLTGRLTDLIYSMETTNTDFYAYQYKPVLKILEAPNQGLLIADEVGLGKTIEAGLIWTELQSRFDFRKLFVLCPAMLKGKWHRELSHRFGVEADVLNAQETLQRLERTTRQRQYDKFAIVASLQGLRASRGHAASQELDKFLEEHEYDEPLIDFLIIDEAHHLRNPESKNAKLGRRLRKVASHVALLSATPVHLGSHDLYQLLNIIDETTFDNKNAFDRVLKANAPLLQARDAVLEGAIGADELRALLKKAWQHPLLRGSRQLAALFEKIETDSTIQDHERRSYLSHKLEEVNLLSHTVARTRKRDVTELRVVREPVPEEVPLSQAERDFYNKVTQLVREYCARRDAHEGFLLVAPQRQMSSSMPAALRSWQRRAKLAWGEQLYEDLGTSTDEIEEESLEETGPLITEIIRRAGSLGDLDELWKNDSKYTRLVDVLRRFISDHPDEKIILFSYFRDTLHYLKERLSADDFSCIVLMGGRDYDKDEILQRFQDENGPQILLSSEVASEGVDLQFSRVIINYDLPWNPMKIEQRIGRIDRLGQEAPRITIWNLFYGDTIDARIYSRLFERLRIFEYALGGIEPVLGEKIRQLTSDLMRNQLSAEQEEWRIEQTAQAVANLRREEERLEEEAAQLLAQGDYILKEIKESRRLHRWVSGKDLRLYVIEYFQLHYPGCEFHQVSPDEEIYDVTLSNQAKYDLDRFIREQRIRETTFLTQNDTRPVRCRFSNNVVSEGQGCDEVVNHLHPIVRFVGHKLDKEARFQTATVAISLARDCLENNLSSGVYVFAVQRWTVEGVQAQEKLDYAVCPLSDSGSLLDSNDAEQLVMSAAMHGQFWKEAPNAIDLSRAARLALDFCLPASDESYKVFVSDIENRNEDLADMQEQTIVERLSSQIERRKEIRDEHLRLGDEPLAKANEGLIRKLESSLERKLIEINERRDLQTESKDVCVGVVKVE